MLLQIAFVTFFLHFGSCQYYECPNVQTNGYVVDLKTGDCDERTTTCPFYNSSALPYEFDFFSLLPAQNLTFEVVVKQNGKYVPIFLSDNHPCNTVKCPLEVLKTYKYKGVASTEQPCKLQKGLLMIKAQMRDEQNRVIFCIINSLIYTS